MYLDKNGSKVLRYHLYCAFEIVIFEKIHKRPLKSRDQFRGTAAMPRDTLPLDMLTPQIIEEYQRLK